MRTREAGSAYQSNVTFTYRADLKVEDAVSLLMPVSQLSYQMPVAGFTHILPPVFDQNLPEGALRAHLQARFAKVIPEMGDFELLGLLGNSHIGRIRVLNVGVDPAIRPVRPTINPSDFLDAADSAPLMMELIEKVAIDSGVSGVQPKALALAEFYIGSDRVTVEQNQLIVKASGIDYPWLAANEYLCMEAARGCGLRVPVVRLTSDQQVLLVERFDFDSSGRPIGFEDMACLSARTSDQRYDGSYEDIASSLCTFVGDEFLEDALESFFTAMVLNCAIENGDAHLKNFGLIYRDPSTPPALAPLYDVVCTTAYIVEDQLALALNGSRRFPRRAEIEQFGFDSCHLTKEEIYVIFGRVLIAVDNMSVDIANLSNEYEEFANDCGHPMIASLTRGMRRTFGLDNDYYPSGYFLTYRPVKVH